MTEATDIGQKPDVAPSLQTVERHLQRVDMRLARLEKKEGLQTPGEEAAKESSRLLIAGGLALVGAKIFGAVGMKVGGARGLAVLKKIEGKIPQNIATALADRRVLKYVAIDGAMGAGVGAALGGLLGWRRGDRISSAHELLTAPIDSIKKLAQSETAYQAQKEKEQQQLNEMAGDISQAQDIVSAKEIKGKYTQRALESTSATTHHSI